MTRRHKPRRLKSQKRPPKCPTGKVPYETQGEALRALERLKQDNAQALVPMPTLPKSVYKCIDHCFWWHMTKREAENGIPVRK